MRQSSPRRISGLRRTSMAVLGAVALGVFGMSAASATPIQTSWNYTFDTQFDTSNTHFSGSSTCTNTSTTKLSWGSQYASGGCGGTQSSLTLGSIAGTSGSGADHPAPIGGQKYSELSGTFATDSAVAFSGLVVTHDNNPVYGSSLSSTQLLTNFYLTPSDSGFNPHRLEFGIEFSETTNTSGTCAVAPLDSTNPCPDIFAVTAGGLNQSFEYDGNDYFLSLFPLMSGGDFLTLSDAACAEAGVSSGCTGWVTEEYSSNAMKFGIAITTEKIQPSTPVPEPGTLGLLALGMALLGIAGITRRRRSFHV